MHSPSEPHFFASPPVSYHSRRAFLQRVGGGFGMLALAGLLSQEGLLEAAEEDRSIQPLAPRKPHFSAKAKSVIWLFMNGGPTHVDTWDYKPGLTKQDGKGLKSFDKKTGFFSDQGGPLFKDPFSCEEQRKSGPSVSADY